MIRPRSAIAFARETIRRDLRDGLVGGGGVLLLGHLVRLALGVLASALVARALGPQGLGTLAVVAAATMIASTVADAGLTGSAVRRIAGDLADLPGQALRTAAVYVRLRLIGGVLACALALALAGPAADLLGLESGGAALVRVAALAVLASAASGAMTTLLHARRSFRPLVVTQSCTTLTTLVILGALFVTGRLSPVTAMAAGAGASVVGGVIGFSALPATWRSAVVAPAAVRGQEARGLMRFSRWLWISAVLSIIASQLDLLLVQRWMAPTAVGVYALAFALAIKAGLLNQILHTLLLPAVSALSTPAGYRAYARRSLSRSIVLALPLALLLPFAGPVITTIYGDAYASATPIFQALGVLVLLELLVQPALLLAFPLDLPWAIAASDAARVAALLAVGALLIPAYGLPGAVAAKFAAALIGAVVIGIPIVLRLRKGVPARAPAPSREPDSAPAAP